MSKDQIKKKIYEIKLGNFKLSLFSNSIETNCDVCQLEMSALNRLPWRPDFCNFGNFTRQLGELEIHVFIAINILAAKFINFYCISDRLDGSLIYFTIYVALQSSFLPGPPLVVFLIKIYFFCQHKPTRVFN